MALRFARIWLLLLPGGAAGTSLGDNSTDSSLSYSSLSEMCSLRLGEAAPVLFTVESGFDKSSDGELESPPAAGP